MEYASKGVAGAGLGLGIAGTALGLLNGGAGNLLSGITGSGDNALVSRYELSMAQELAAKDGQIALLEADKYTDAKMVEVYKDLQGQISGIAAEVRANKAEQDAVNCQQAVYNGTNNATIACLQQQVAMLQSLTKVVVPKTSVCPEPMDRYNSWTAPTTTTTPAA